MNRPSVSVAVVMQRRMIENRWQSEIWEPIGVLPDDDGAQDSRLIVQSDDVTQWLYPGMRIALYRDEAEGYYLNLSTSEPSVFVMWRMQADCAVPQALTASYGEAARWMDGGEHVDQVPMPGALCVWLGEFVREHFRPEPRKRIKPQSFKHPKDRART